MVHRKLIFLFIPFMVLQCSGNTHSSNHHVPEALSHHENAHTRRLPGLKLSDDVTIKVSTFREIVLRTMLYNKVWYSHPLGAATALILNLITSKQKASAWEQVELKVRKMIHEKIDDNNINLLSNFWNQITSSILDKRKYYTSFPI